MCCEVFIYGLGGTYELLRHKCLHHLPFQIAFKHFRRQTLGTLNWLAPRTWYRVRVQGHMPCIQARAQLFNKKRNCKGYGKYENWFRGGRSQKSFPAESFMCFVLTRWTCPCLRLHHSHRLLRQICCHGREDAALLSDSFFEQSEDLFPKICVR